MRARTHKHTQVYLKDSDENGDGSLDFGEFIHAIKFVFHRVRENILEARQNAKGQVDRALLSPCPPPPPPLSVCMCCNRSLSPRIQARQHQRQSTAQRPKTAQSTSGKT